MQKIYIEAIYLLAAINAILCNKIHIFLTLLHRYYKWKYGYCCLLGNCRSEEIFSTDFVGI